MISEIVCKNFIYWFNNQARRTLIMLSVLTYIILVNWLIIKKPDFTFFANALVIMITGYIMTTVISYLIVYLPNPANYWAHLDRRLALETLLYLITPMFISPAFILSLCVLGFSKDIVLPAVVGFYWVLSFAVYWYLQAFLHDLMPELSLKKKVGILFQIAGMLWIAVIIARLHLEVTGKIRF